MAIGEWRCGVNTVRQQTETWQVRESGQMIGERDKCGNTIVGSKDLEGTQIKACRKLVHDRLPAFLVVGQPRRCGMLGNLVCGAADIQLVVCLRLRVHGVPQPVDPYDVAYRWLYTTRHEAGQLQRSSYDWE